MKRIIKVLEESGFFLLLILVLQPISDFIKTNINDQVFNLARSLSYYIIFIIWYTIYNRIHIISDIMYTIEYIIYNM